MDGLRLATALEGLRARVADVRLGLALPEAETGRKTQEELVGQIDDYLLPRLRQLDAPLLVAVGGSTGAGKSTLVNTLVGAEVSKAGWLRPTTRSPVLACNPADLAWFSSTRILPGLARGNTGGPRTLELVPDAAVPAGLALLDPPDIDSVVAENRDLAGQLLAAADLWIFVTTAARYADAVPWELLHTAEQRSTALSVVLNRVPPEGIEEIGDHLRSMLRAEGLGNAAVFAIPEVALANERIPEPDVAALRGWLDSLAADADARASVVRKTLTGALASLRTRVLAVAGALDEQERTAGQLRDEARDRYEAALATVEDGVRGGTVLQGEVLARWQEFVGTGQFTRNLEAQIGRFRDRVTAFFTGRSLADAAVEHAVESSLETLVRAAADRAAEQTAELWRASPAGRSLAAPTTSSPDFGEKLATEIRAWQGRVLDLVAQEGGHRRSVARLTSFGVNGAGLVLMLAVFSQTGGLSGAEVLIAGGTSAVSQKLLEALFGDAAVRTLAATAREDLLVAVGLLLDAERARYASLVDAAAPGPDGTELRAALNEFESIRSRRDEAA